MAKTRQRFTSSYGGRCFGACGQGINSTDILAGNAARQWLMTAGRHVA